MLPSHEGQEGLLVDCLQRLNRSGLAYMLTGSMASNYWGVPRTTHGLDFVLVMHPGEVSLIAAAFKYGFFLQQEAVRLPEQVRACWSSRKNLRSCESSTRLLLIWAATEAQEWMNVIAALPL